MYLTLVCNKTGEVFPETTLNLTILVEPAACFFLDADLFPAVLCLA